MLHGSRLKRQIVAFGVGLGIGSLLYCGMRVTARRAQSEEPQFRKSAVLAPADAATSRSLETATLACGCFWGPDSRFGAVPGVVRTRVGYSGGQQPNPTYDAIGDHTETVEVDYDPSKISFEKILEVYATAPNVHRAAWKRQYRNAVFYHGEAQRDAAQKFIAGIQDAHVDIEPFRDFTRAEDYHQKYHLQLSSLWKEYQRTFPDFRHFTDSTAAARINGYIMGHAKPEQVRADIGTLGLSPEGQALLMQESSRVHLDCQ